MLDGTLCEFAGCGHTATFSTANGSRCHFHAGWDAAKAYAARAYADLLLELKAIEWQGGSGRCPNCHGYEPEHKPDCTLAAALADAEAERGD